jgi:phage terminase large subunit
VDFNPVMEFRAHTELDKSQIDFILLTYKDNEGLSESIVKEIESRKGNKYFWTVYGEGQIGEVTGKIYQGWKLDLDEVPFEARLERYGLDFGYTNDPTSIVALYYYNGGYILDEVAYTKGLSNKQIADILLNLKRALIVADSAEPKSIDEIRSFGLNVVPCDKGKGSVRQRIQMAQDQQISVTKQSVNVIKEYRNYFWVIDKDGRVLNEPSPLFNHSMDAFSYALSSLVPSIRRKEYVDSYPLQNFYQTKPKTPWV